MPDCKLIECVGVVQTHICDDKWRIYDATYHLGVDDPRRIDFVGTLNSVMREVDIKNGFDDAI